MSGEKSYSEFASRLDERTAYTVELKEDHGSFADLSIDAPPDISILSPVRFSEFRLIKVEVDSSGNYCLRVM